jgi:hypothetical protein
LSTLGYRYLEIFTDLGIPTGTLPYLIKRGEKYADEAISASPAREQIKRIHSNGWDARVIAVVFKLPECTIEKACYVPEKSMKEKQIPKKVPSFAVAKQLLGPRSKVLDAKLPPRGTDSIIPYDLNLQSAEYTLPLQDELIGWSQGNTFDPNLNSELLDYSAPLAHTLEGWVTENVYFLFTIV